MNIGQAIAQLNYLAVLVAALASFVIGGFWFSDAMFGEAWMRANAFSREDLRERNMVKIFGLSFLLALVSSFVLALFIGPDGGFGTGIIAGFLVGIGWVATSLGVTDLFESKPTHHFLVNAGYHVVSFMVMGAILGLWK